VTDSKFAEHIMRKEMLQEDGSNDANNKKLLITVAAHAEWVQSV